MNDANAISVLKFAIKTDICDQLSWFEKNGEIIPLVNCNDLFSCASADCEEITPDDMPLFFGTIEEVAAISRLAASLWGTQLFACRKRNMGPQLAVLISYSKLLPDAWNAVKHLWDAIPQKGGD